MLSQPCYTNFSVEFIYRVSKDGNGQYMFSFAFVRFASAQKRLRFSVVTETLIIRIFTFPTFIYSIKSKANIYVRTKTYCTYVVYFHLQLLQLLQINLSFNIGRKVFFRLIFNFKAFQRQLSKDKHRNKTSRIPF